jgi:hypothetical protein
MPPFEMELFIYSAEEAALRFEEREREREREANKKTHTHTDERTTKTLTSR